MEFLLSAEVRPFTIAGAIMVALVVVEIVSMVVGAQLSHLIDHSLDLDGHDAINLNWLNVGGVPLLVLIMIALGAFSIAGVLIQEIARAISGPLPALVASVGAAGLAVPAVRASSRAIAKIIPRDETYAVELPDLVGLTADVTVGPLDQGLPGAVRLKDRHGNWHTLRARAAPDAHVMPKGSKVLLVDFSAGVFTAIPAPGDLG